jgi:hypothetical protein
MPTRKRPRRGRATPPLLHHRVRVDRSRHQVPRQPPAHASTIVASIRRSCSGRRRVPARVPNWAPTTPPAIRSRARRMSTVWFA